MCVVLPVDHTPCSHTVAIWQYCIHAFRSFSGLKPCSRVRQHPRPILTRKMCIPRQPSTLLHPSSPNDSSPPNIEILSISAQPTEETRTSYPFPVLTQTPPTPLPNEVIFQRRASVLHSALSDDEWEEPLHSSQSDNDYESDDDGYEEKGADADTESFDDQVAKEAAVVVKTGRMARASRISFHGQSLRILV
ncbi:hypothetical protein CC80DRAFT_230926 [Byssothecium circinans]|uniref:Uncharacterized protein n=1 Tax=Byssothecium circinans TaxID=147558 RepID=A0A6A5UJ94_9PLEO|nr:hypothetical protein CC80DRAFT_230926 [Byssothecium circinans]